MIESVNTNNKKIKKYGIIIGIVILLIIVAIIVTVSIINTNNNNAYCEKLKGSLVGKSFKGYLHGSVRTWEIGITFIDEKTLTFDYYVESKNGNIFLGNDGFKRNVSYETENGSKCIKIIIDEAAVNYNDGAEPFEFRNNGKLYTPNYDSKMPMVLYEVRGGK